ncbi:MAG: 3-oxoacyl-[acyl-carrier-protein] reductase FabG [Anaerolineae bacterium]|nr:3-oxoacyl-[acyl-carrier-protein] reductase FabG [Anaerolineae bacterium]
MALTNRVAVIMGATGQLGPAVAKAFADAGVRLVLVAPDQAALDALFQTLGYRESRVMLYAADSLDEQALHALAQAVQERFGRLDIVAHLTTAYRGGGLLDTTDEMWQDMFEENLQTALYAARALTPLLIKNEWGRILTISSGVTQNPPPGSLAYLTAKSALETFTLALANEFKSKHITANVVLLRALDTPAERAKQPNKTTGWVKPEEVAATLVFLCSDEAGAITGARIPVVGGA